MAQPTSSGWAGNVAAAFRQINFGVLISWLRQTASGVNYFTIGNSLIGGSDLIKSGGSFPAFLDQYAYTDYSNYVLNLAVERRSGQYPWGMILAQADVTLDNTSKLFLPNYDATIGSGILPNRPIKIALGVAGETLNQFVGFTGIPENTIGAQRQTILHAFDVFDYLNSYTSTASGVLTTSGVYINQFAHTIIADLLSEAGLSTNQYVLDTSLQNRIGLLAPAGQKIGQIIQDLSTAEGALAFADENGTIRWWNRQHFTTTSGVSQGTFTFANLSELKYANTPVINDVIVEASPRAVQSLQTLSGVQSLNPALPIPIPGSTVRTNLVSNPSFETDTAWWALNGSATLTRITTDHFVGSACGQLGTSVAGDFMSSLVIAPTIGLNLQAQARVKAPAGTGIFIGLMVGGQLQVSYGQLATGGWDLLATDAVNLGSHSMATVVIGPTQGFYGATLEVDAVLCETVPYGTKSANYGFYFDGNTTNTATLKYGWNGTANDSSSTETNSANGKVTVAVSFADGNGALPVVGIPAPVGGGSGTSSFTANSASDGSGTNLNANVSVSNIVSQGSTWQATFINTYGSVLYLTSLNLYGRPATITQVISERYQDIGSIATYGTNPANNGDPLTISDDMIQDSGTAAALGYILVSDYRYPNRRYEDVPVFANPALQIGDTTTLVNSDTGETLPIYITGIRSTLDNDGQLQMFLDFEARAIVRYFVIGSSAIGGSDAIAP